MKLLDNPDIQKNDDGHLLLDTPYRADGMRLIRQAAENGQPNALSSIIWFDVIEDQIDKAVKDFETYLPLVEPWIARERARIDKIWLVSMAEKKPLLTTIIIKFPTQRAMLPLLF